MRCISAEDVTVRFSKENRKCAGEKSPAHAFGKESFMYVAWEEVEKTQNSVRLFALINIILTVVAILYGFVSIGKLNNPFVMVLALVPVGILWWIFTTKLKAYKAMYKSVVVDRAAQGMFDRYVYSPEAGFSQEEIRATGIMSMGNRYDSEDMLEGSYKGVTFRRADIYIAQHHSNGKSSYTVVYLRGTWLTFTYNKMFLSDLQIRTKGFRYSDKKTSRIFTRESERRHSFETESVEFNDAFECTCQNDSEAFYLLTPRVMQMLLLLKDEFGYDFMVGFVQNRLHFAINSGKNNMEPPVFSGTSLGAEVETVRRELKIITNIVDSLAIDRDIFKE